LDESGDNILDMSQYAPPWSDAELNILKGNVNLVPYSKIVELLPGRTIDAIKLRARLVGIEKSGKRFPRRKLNEEFFAVPTILSSYWAGFLAADGCILRPPINPRTEVRLGIHQRDIDHLRRFAIDVGYDGKIAQHQKNIRGITICAAYQWVTDLWANFNIGPQKTFTLGPPHLSGELSLAYSIGYIDGDGCWATHSSHDNYLMLVVIGTRELLSWLISIWKYSGARIGFPNLSYRRNCWRLTLSGRKATEVAHLLSKLDVPRLQRKWRVARRETYGQEDKRKS